MKKNLTIIMLIFMYSAFCSASVPKWMTDLEKAFPSEKYIRAVGEGNSQNSAKQSAIVEVSNYFNQSIDSQTQALSIFSREDYLYSEKATINQNLNTSTNTQLFTLQYTNCFYDKTSNHFYICAYIERQKAWNIITEKMNLLKSKCQHKINEVKKETEPLLKLILLNQAQNLYFNFYDLYEMALVIYPKKVPSLTESANYLQEEISNLSSIRTKTGIKIKVSGDKQNRIKNKITSLLSQNKFLTNGTEENYILDAHINWNQSQFGELFSSTPQISLTITKSGRTLVSFAAECESFSAYNFQTLEKVSIAHLEELLDEQFISQCFQ